VTQPAFKLFNKSCFQLQYMIIASTEHHREPKINSCKFCCPSKRSRKYVDSQKTNFCVHRLYGSFRLYFCVHRHHQFSDIRSLAYGEQTEMKLGERRKNAGVWGSNTGPLWWRSARCTSRPHFPSPRNVMRKKKKIALMIFRKNDFEPQ
jgi:hypothetical protein